MNTATPLKDAYEARKKAINADTRYTDKDITLLAKGDYACIKTPTAQYFGFVKSIGPKNVVIEAPYGGWADMDYNCIQELKFPKNQVKIFAKPLTAIEA